MISPRAGAQTYIGHANAFMALILIHQKHQPMGRSTLLTRNGGRGHDHELFYNIAKNNIIHYGCQNVCKLERKRSDDFEPPKNIGILVVDGNAEMSQSVISSGTVQTRRWRVDVC